MTQNFKIDTIMFGQKIESVALQERKLPPEIVDDMKNNPGREYDIAPEEGKAHYAGSDCWCEPECFYFEPRNHNVVWLHKRVQ